MLKTKKTLTGFLKNLTDNTKKHSLKLLVAALISGVFAVIVFAAFFGLYYLIMSKTSLNTLLAVRFTFMILNYLLVLILASIVQIVTFKVFFDPQIKIPGMIDAVKSYFWRFLGLSIIINILLFLFSLPLYVAILLFVIQNYILSLITLLIGALFLLLFASYIMFSPFILIEKQKKIYPAIVESMNLASSDIWGVFIKLLILIVAMVLLNSIVSLFIAIPIAGPIIELAGIFVFFLIFIIYLFTIYQDLKIEA